MNGCSLWITVARTDVAFMLQTIPHLVKMCDYPFAEKVLAIDTAPLSGEKTLRHNIGDLGRLGSLCGKLVEEGVMDRAIDIDYSDNYRRIAYKKHFGRYRIKNTHNWKGYPVLGSIFCIEECKSDYFLHFDSDMLLYQEPGFNWIEKGLEILKNNPDILYVRPQAGPQDESGHLYEKYKAQKSPGGFWRLDFFSSRCFLIDRRRFEKLLPLKVAWAKTQGRIKDKLPRQMVEFYSNLTGCGLLESWETMLTGAMKRKTFLRADIADNRAWTLHPAKHDDSFIRALPGIIERVEKGGYPPSQAGYYDLKPEYWKA